MSDKLQETDSDTNNCTMCKHFFSYQDIYDNDLEEPDWCGVCYCPDVNVDWGNPSDSKVCSHFIPYNP